MANLAWIGLEQVSIPCSNSNLFSAKMSSWRWLCNFVLQLLSVYVTPWYLVPGIRFLVLEQGATIAVKKDFTTKKTKLNFSFTELAKSLKLHTGTCIPVDLPAAGTWYTYKQALRRSLPQYIRCKPTTIISECMHTYMNIVYIHKRLYSQPILVRKYRYIPTCMYR